MTTLVWDDCIQTTDVHVYNTHTKNVNFIQLCDFFASHFSLDSTTAATAFVHTAWKLNLP